LLLTLTALSVGIRLSATDAAAQGLTPAEVLRCNEVIAGLSGDDAEREACIALLAQQGILPAAAAAGQSLNEPSG
jgi:hypothetical protein